MSRGYAVVALLAGACVSRTATTARDTAMDHGADRAPADAGAGGGADGGDAAGEGGPGTDSRVDAGGDVAACVPSPARCPPQPMPTQACDPICQGACPCGQKCDVLFVAACMPAVGQVPPGGDCQIPDDDCAPGATCIKDQCSQTCSQFCRTDADCPNRARCQRFLTVAGLDTGYMLCDIPPSGCDPRAPAACPRAGLGCYLLDLSGDDTGCDCAGDLPEGGACLASRECAPGLLCAPSPLGLTACRRVCSQAAPACPTGSSCQPWTGSTRWGWCERDVL